MKKENETKQLLPALLVEAETCGEAWEKTVDAVWNHGLEIKQHYEDEFSREASVLVNVTNPLKEPRFSRKDLISVTLFMTNENRKKHELGDYRSMQYTRDLLDGDMDNSVEMGVEAYTYHERLACYGMQNPKHEKMLRKKGLLLKLIDPRKSRLFPSDKKPPVETVNQFELLIQKGREEPISRKLQMTTWQPHKDLLISGAPCLQRIWFRIIEERYLVMETMWRSRDLYKAFPANCVIMVELGKHFAKAWGLELVQMMDFSNSLHIYASDYDQVRRHFEIIRKRAEQDP